MGNESPKEGWVEEAVPWPRHGSPDWLQLVASCELNEDQAILRTITKISWNGKCEIVWAAYALLLSITIFVGREKNALLISRWELHLVHRLFPPHLLWIFIHGISSGCGPGAGPMTSEDGVMYIVIHTLSMHKPGPRNPNLEPLEISSRLGHISFWTLWPRDANSHFRSVGQVRMPKHPSDPAAIHLLYHDQEFRTTSLAMLGSKRNIWFSSTHI